MYTFEKAHAISCPHLERGNTISSSIAKIERVLGFICFNSKLEPVNSSTAEEAGEAEALVPDGVTAQTYKQEWQMYHWAEAPYPNI